MSMSQNRDLSAINPTTVRAIYAKDEKLKNKILDGEKLLKSMKHDRIPILNRGFDIGDWYIQEFLIRPVFSIKKLLRNLTDLNDVFFREGLQIFQDYVLAVHFIHGKKFVLTNINLETTYVIQPYNDRWIQIMDFDEAVELGKPIDDRGDFKYWQPERLEGKHTVWSEEDDIYAITIMLYSFIHNGKYPFSGNTKDDYTKSVQEGNYEFELNIYPELAILLAVMLRANPKERLTPADFSTALLFISKQQCLNVPAAPIKLSNKGPIPEELLKQVRPEMAKHVTEWLANIKTDTSNATDFVDKLKDHKFVLVSIGLVALVIFGIGIWLCVSHKETEDPDVKDDKKTALEITNAKDNEMKAELT